MIEPLISDILRAAHAVDPQLQGRWIAEQVVVAMKKEGLPTTGVLHCPSTGSAMQPHQRQQHVTTAGEKPQISPSPHPHGADYAEAIRYQNAAEHFRRIRNDLLHSEYRMGQGQLLTEEDKLRLHKASLQLNMLIADMLRRAGHFQTLTSTSTPEPAAISR